MTKSSNNDRSKSCACLCDPGTAEKYTDASVAVYATSTTPLEMFIRSYNVWKGMTYLTVDTPGGSTASGYKIHITGESDYDYGSGTRTGTVEYGPSNIYGKNTSINSFFGSPGRTSGNLAYYDGEKQRLHCRSWDSTRRGNYGNQASGLPQVEIVYYGV